MKKNILIVLLCFMCCVGLSRTAHAAFDRDLEPVIVLGSEVGKFLGKSIDGIRVYAYSSTENSWHPIPCQVDEFEPNDDPEKDKVVVWDGDGVLSSLDEIVCMAKDAGQKSDNISWPPDIDSKMNTRYETAVVEPATFDTGYVYVYYSASLDTSETNYVSYSGDEVNTSVYSVGHDTDDASGFPDLLKIKGNDVDFLESWRVRVAIDEIVAEADVIGEVKGNDIYFSEYMDTTIVFKAAGGYLPITANAKAFHNIDLLKTKLGQVRLLRQHTMTILISVEGYFDMPANIPILIKYYGNLVDFKPSFTLDLGESIKKLETDHIEFSTAYNEKLKGAKFYGNDFLSGDAEDSEVDDEPKNTIFKKELSDADWPGTHWYGFSGQPEKPVNNASFFTMAELYPPRLAPGRAPALFYFDYKDDKDEKTTVHGTTGLRIYDWDKTAEQGVFAIDARYRTFYFTNNHTRSELQYLYDKYKNAAKTIITNQTHLDNVKPGVITDLKIDGRTDTSMTLVWTAKGNDGDDGGGAAAKYYLRYSEQAPKDPEGGTDWNWWSNVAKTVENVPSPAKPGTQQSVTVNGLSEATVYYFRINVEDAAKNSSGLSKVASHWTTPVELVSFNGVIRGQNAVYLSWATASESNNLGFAIERRLLGVNEWQEVGFVKGAGTTAQEQRYSFIDEPGQSGEWNYRLRQIDTDGSFEYSDPIQVSIAAPQAFVLQQNYPNPFNPETTIDFQVPEETDGRMNLTIYDMLGRHIRTLVDDKIQTGYHSVKWDGTDVNGVLTSSGVYIYRLSAGTFSATRKMIKLQ